jgi:CheY-like chemotaxis protein
MCHGSFAMRSRARRKLAATASSYLLRHFGHDAHGESDGVSGLATALTGDFDIILSDVLMPGIDGYEFAHKIKEDARFTSIPLVAITALAMAEDRERILRAGFDGYISKPIEPQTFVGQVEAFVNGAT